MSAIQTTQQAISAAIKSVAGDVQNLTYEEVSDDVTFLDYDAIPPLEKIEDLLSFPKLISFPETGSVDEGWLYDKPGSNAAHYVDFQFPTPSARLGLSGTIQPERPLDARDVQSIFTVITMVRPFPASAGIFFQVFTQAVPGDPGLYYNRRSTSKVNNDADTWPVGEKIILIAGLDTGMHSEITGSNRIQMDLEMHDDGNGGANGTPGHLIGYLKYFSLKTSTSDNDYAFVMHAMGYIRGAALNTGKLFEFNTLA